MKIGDKVTRRFVNGNKPDGKTGIIRKINSKWKTTLVYWCDIEKEFWHCWDDLRIIDENR